MMQAPSLKNMEMHHESKHPKVPWDPNIYQNTHEIYGGTTKARSCFVPPAPHVSRRELLCMEL